MQNKCDKPEDQSDGISIQNIGGVFIVIFGNGKIIFFSATHEN